MEKILFLNMHDNCTKLAPMLHSIAAFYTIKDKLYERKEETAGRYSYDVPPEGTIMYDSDSDFAKAINNKSIYEILPVLDELMETLKYINPRLYSGILDKL